TGTWRLPGPDQAAARAAHVLPGWCLAAGGALQMLGERAALVLPPPAQAGQLHLQLALALEPPAGPRPRLTLRLDGQALQPEDPPLTAAVLQLEAGPVTRAGGPGRVLSLHLAWPPGAAGAGVLLRDLQLSLRPAAVAEDRSAPTASLYRVREFQPDPAWYEARYPHVVRGLQAGRWASLAEFQRLEGDRRHCSPSALFSAPFYAERAGYDARAPGWSLVEDYLRHGAPRGLSPHWLFDEAFVQARDLRLAQAQASGGLTGAYLYFLRLGQRSGLRPHPLYCASTVAQAPGAQAAAPGRLFDWLVTDAHEQGVCPSVLFDEAFYLARLPAAVRAQIGPGLRFGSALQHCCERGLAQGRSPLPDLDVEHYLRECARHGRLAELAGQSVVEHFLRVGVAAGLDPNPRFQAAHYLARHPTAAEEIRRLGLLGPLEHYLLLGRDRGWSAAPPLAERPVDLDQARGLYERRTRLEAARLDAAAPLRLDLPAAPDLSVIVPVLDHHDFTAALLLQLAALQRQDPDLRLEVIVVDNGSTDRTTDLGERVHGLKLLRLPQAVGYPAACNAGARQAAGAHLLFLNNDIELVPGTLQAAVRALADPTVGAVGGQVLQLDGRLQEAGGVVFRDGSTAGCGRGQDPLTPRYRRARDVDYCSGCCLAVRRGDFEALGGFDEGYSPGYYEDTDLCLRLWARGLRVRYDPALAVHHYEHASYGRGRGGAAAWTLIQARRERFAAHHAERLTAHPERALDRLDALAFWRTGPPADLPTDPAPRDPDPQDTAP
ncbi:glycosyltransferase family 2 protein, partial [Ideonella livida]